MKIFSVTDRPVKAVKSIIPGANGEKILLKTNDTLDYLRFSVLDGDKVILEGSSKNAEDITVFMEKLQSIAKKGVDVFAELLKSMNKNV